MAYRPEKNGNGNNVESLKGAERMSYEDALLIKERFEEKYPPVHIDIEDEYFVVSVGDTISKVLLRKGIDISPDGKFGSAHRIDIEEYLERLIQEKMEELVG